MVPPTNSPLGNKPVSRPSSIAGSEFFDSTEENNNQRAADAHLAQSMRTRSVNLLDRVNSNNNNINQNNDLLVTPLRGDRGLNSNNNNNNLGGGGGGINSAQRRGSVGNSNTRDHLADDLMQDQGYYVERNVHSSRNQQQQQTQRPLNPQHPFYRHQRNLSDSSLDGFVDHRRPPIHTLTSGGGGGGGNRGIMISGGERNLPESNYGIRTTSNRTPGLRRESSGEVLGTRRSRSRSISPSRNTQDPSLSIITVRNSTRQGLTSKDLDENAIISDDNDDEHLEERQSPRAYIERHISQTSNRSDHDRLHEDDLIGGFSHELSRQGSSLGKPEEDVCFPSHGAVDPDLLDLGLSSMYGHSGMGGGIGGGGGGVGDQQDNDHLHLHQHLHSHQHQHNGVAGVLQNFPFPFDFGALEEFAEREKEGMPIPAAKKRGGNAPPEYGNSSSGGVGAGGSKMRNRLGASLNSGGEEDINSGRRTTRQRKLSESVAPGRFQRKLAIFEGEGEEGPNEPRGERGSAGAGTSTWSSILDAKTPLMGGGNGGGGGGTNNAAKPRGGYGATNGPGITSANAAARPYRFSFYSNALPSTIHARSLAEIPAEGQTFEELFVGHQTNEYEDESQSQSQTGGGGGGNTDPRMAFSPASQSNTGANTPNGPNSHSNQPSLSGHQLNSARPGGIPQTSGGGMREKVREARMRTEMDTEANTWWLDVLCPTDQEMKVLSKVFGIHPLTTEDIQMEETREKIELFRNYYFVCFRSFEQDPYSPTYLEPLNMYIIVFREGTLSFHFRGTPHPQNVRRRIKQLKDYINVTSDWISYALIDDVIDAFTPLILNIEYEVDSIDELVLILKEAEQSDMLRRIGTCRKKVMGLLRLMGNKGDVVKGLSKRCNENWAVAPKSDIGLYLSDIQDHITTSIQNLTHYEKILSRSHSNYLAQISIEMTDANNQINDVLSKLTALGTVLIPMNLITGLWGMNVHVPGQDVENLHWFFSILGCLGAIAIIGAWLTYRVFVRSA